ncbi:hypothetical protein ACFTY8_47135 [Streptomyces mirabilis]|uniref:hypothetical protein n=1 Tax=Streptomyces mirabilis TaxID=68239 RepID=UPI00362B73F9
MAHRPLLAALGDEPCRPVVQDVGAEARAALLSVLQVREDAQSWRHLWTGEHEGDRLAEEPAAGRPVVADGGLGQLGEEDQSITWPTA